MSYPLMNIRHNRAQSEVGRSLQFRQGCMQFRPPDVYNFGQRVHPCPYPFGRPMACGKMQCVDRAFYFPMRLLVYCYIKTPRLYMSRILSSVRFYPNRTCQEVKSFYSSGLFRSKARKSFGQWLDKKIVW